jgi:hypothetical protein
VQGWRSRLVRTGVATEPVLFDLQAHELLLGEGVAEDLLQPDCVHPALHPCCVVKTHNRPLSSEAQEGSVRNASRRSAAVVTALPDRQARARPWRCDGGRSIGRPCAVACFATSQASATWAACVAREPLTVPQIARFSGPNAFGCPAVGVREGRASSKSGAEAGVRGRRVLSGCTEGGEHDHRRGVWRRRGGLCVRPQPAAEVRGRTAGRANELPGHSKEVMP